ncbi:MAG TPA: NAD-dependent epimerase/dehydratase family protein, partial [Cyclobacteriaceae bacterium]|nr:NAD-dependent epimerase/dehydratase family protein [Cyclobacteriaceae bacterium]
GNSILRKLISEKIPVVGLRRTNSNTLPSMNLSREVEWRETDVNNSLSLAEALKNIDTVIHTAAVVSFDPRAKERIFQTNVIGTQNVVNACLALGIPRLIFISSVAALGRKKGITEINEENKWIDSDLNSDYAKSKYLAELEIYRGQEEGLSVSIVNPSVILAAANPNKSSAQIFKYVNDERLFYTDGHINYVDARDVADVIFKIYENKSAGEKFIANAGTINVKELISKIAIRLDKKEPSIKINPKLLLAAAWLEEMRCKFAGTEALISRQSVKTSREKFIYQNHKSINRLNMAYRPLDETLDWCCQYYREAFTTNKQK